MKSLNCFSDKTCTGLDNWELKHTQQMSGQALDQYLAIVNEVEAHGLLPAQCRYNLQALRGEPGGGERTCGAMAGQGDRKQVHGQYRQQGTGTWQSKGTQQWNQTW